MDHCDKSLYLSTRSLDAESKQTKNVPTPLTTPIDWHTSKFGSQTTLNRIDLLKTVHSSLSRPIVNEFTKSHRPQQYNKQISECKENDECGMGMRQESTKSISSQGCNYFTIPVVDLKKRDPFAEFNERIKLIKEKFLNPKSSAFFHRDDDDIRSLLELSNFGCYTYQDYIKFVNELFEGHGLFNIAIDYANINGQLSMQITVSLMEALSEYIRSPSSGAHSTCPLFTCDEFLVDDKLDVIKYVKYAAHFIYYIVFNGKLYMERDGKLYVKVENDCRIQKRVRVTLIFHHDILIPLFVKRFSCLYPREKDGVMGFTFVQTSPPDTPKFPLNYEETKGQSEKKIHITIPFTHGVNSFQLERIIRRRVYCIKVALCAIRCVGPKTKFSEPVNCDDRGVLGAFNPLIANYDNDGNIIEYKLLNHNELAPIKFTRFINKYYPELNGAGINQRFENFINQNTGAEVDKSHVDSCVPGGAFSCDNYTEFVPSNKTQIVNLFKPEFLILDEYLYISNADDIINIICELFNVDCRKKGSSKHHTINSSSNSGFVRKATTRISRLLRRVNPFKK